MSETMTNAAEQLAAAAWGEEAPATATVETPAPGDEPAKTEPTKVEPTPAEPAKTEPQEQVFDANEYLKTNLGWDNWDVAKQEVEQLRKLKEANPQELKFANEDSEKLFKALQEGNEDSVYEILSKKKQFERIEKLDISDVQNAADVVKLSIRAKYPDLDDSEINDIFEEQYSRYEKPKKDDLDGDDEYEQKLIQWKLREDAINKKIVRDAKIAKPELAKLRSEIVYPEIKKEVQQSAAPQTSQEELEKFAALKDGFLKSANSFVQTFDGFKATVKDKDVSYDVSYNLSGDEKQEVAKLVNDFAENGLNTNSLFASRWLLQDGTINSEQMVKDLSKILFADKMEQKFVTDAANKRLEEYLKEKKNVKIEHNNNGSTFVPGGEAEKMEEVRSHFWDN